MKSIDYSDTNLNSTIDTVLSSSKAETKRGRNETMSPRGKRSDSSKEWFGGCARRCPSNTLNSLSPQPNILGARRTVSPHSLSPDDLLKTGSFERPAPRKSSESKTMSNRGSSLHIPNNNISRSSSPTDILGKKQTANMSPDDSSKSVSRSRSPILANLGNSDTNDVDKLGPGPKPASRSISRSKSPITNNLTLNNNNESPRKSFTMLLDSRELPVESQAGITRDPVQPDRTSSIQRGVSIRSMDSNRSLTPVRRDALDRGKSNPNITIKMGVSRLPSGDIFRSKPISIGSMSDSGTKPPTGGPMSSPMNITPFPMGAPPKIQSSESFRTQWGDSDSEKLLRKTQSAVDTRHIDRPMARQTSRASNLLKQGSSDRSLSVKDTSPFKTGIRTSIPLNIHTADTADTLEPYLPSSDLKNNSKTANVAAYKPKEILQEEPKIHENYPCEYQVEHLEPPNDKPTIDKPTIETPTIETPTIETATIDTPTIETPTIETPSMDTQDDSILFPRAEPFPSGLNGVNLNIDNKLKEELDNSQSMWFTGLDPEDTLKYVQHRDSGKDSIDQTTVHNDVGSNMLFPAQGANQSLKIPQTGIQNNWGSSTPLGCVDSRHDGLGTFRQMPNYSTNQAKTEFKTVIDSSVFDKAQLNKYTTQTSDYYGHQYAAPSPYDTKTTYASPLCHNNMWEGTKPTPMIHTAVSVDSPNHHERTRSTPLHGPTKSYIPKFESVSTIPYREAHTGVIRSVTDVAPFIPSASAPTDSISYSRDISNRYIPAASGPAPSAAPLELNLESSVILEGISTPVYQSEPVSEPVNEPTTLLDSSHENKHYISTEVKPNYVPPDIRPYMPPSDVAVKPLMSQVEDLVLNSLKQGYSKNTCKTDSSALGILPSANINNSDRFVKQSEKVATPRSVRKNEGQRLLDIMKSNRSSGKHIKNGAALDDIAGSDFNKASSLFVDVGNSVYEHKHVGASAKHPSLRVMAPFNSTRDYNYCFPSEQVPTSMSAWVYSDTPQYNGYNFDANINFVVKNYLGSSYHIREGIDRKGEVIIG